MNIDYKTRFNFAFTVGENRLVFESLDKPGAVAAVEAKPKKEIKDMDSVELKDEIDKVDKKLDSVAKSATEIIAKTTQRINSINDRIKVLEQTHSKDPKTLRELKIIKDKLVEVKKELKGVVEGDGEAAPDKGEEGKEEEKKDEVLKPGETAPKITTKQQELRGFSRKTRLQAESLYKLITTRPPPIDKIEDMVQKCNDLNNEMVSEIDEAVLMKGLALAPFRRELKDAKRYLVSIIGRAEAVIDSGQPAMRLKYKEAKVRANLSREKALVVSRILSQVPPVAVKNMFHSTNPDIVQKARLLYKQLLPLVKNIRGCKTLRDVKYAQNSKFFKELAVVKNSYDELVSASENEGEKPSPNVVLSNYEIEVRKTERSKPFEWRETDSDINEHLSEKQSEIRGYAENARGKANELYELITSENPNIGKIKKAVKEYEEYSRRLAHPIPLFESTKGEGLGTFTKELVAAKEYLDQTIEGAKAVLNNEKPKSKNEFNDVRNKSKMAKIKGRLIGRFFNTVPSIGLKNLRICDDKVISKGANRVRNDLKLLLKEINKLPTVEAIQEAQKDPKFRKKMAKLNRTYRTLKMNYEKKYDKKLSINEKDKPKEKPKGIDEQLNEKLNEKQKTIRTLSGDAENKADHLKTLITASPLKNDEIESAVKEYTKLSAKIGKEHSKLGKPIDKSLSNFAQEMKTAQDYLDKTIDGANKAIKSGEAQNADDFKEAKNNYELRKTNARIVASVYSKIPSVGLFNLENCDNEDIKKDATKVHEKITKLYWETVGKGEADEYTVKRMKKGLADPKFSEGLANLEKEYQELKGKYEKESGKELSIN